MPSKGGVLQYSPGSVGGNVLRLNGAVEHAQRLWLCGDVHERPGVLGMARCVRREPNGDAVRCVLDMGGGLGAEAMVATAARLDLATNVFQGGVHGALMSSPLQVSLRGTWRRAA
jgi:hypothetical protein